MGYLKLHKCYCSKNMQWPTNEQEWTQLDNNPTAIGVLLTTIDGLKVNEHLTISRISKEEYYETQKKSSKENG